MTDLSKGATSAHPMTAGPDDRRPAFSPNGKVIAFIRRTPTSSGGSDGDLCFVSCRLDAAPGRVHQGPELQRRPAHVVAGRPRDPRRRRRPEGREPDGARRVHHRQPELLEHQDWVWQGLVTDKMHGTKPGEGILFAAFSPDGKTVALVANWGVQNTSLFKIFTAAWAGGQLGTPTPVAPAIRACEVAWRSDSQELVVTAGRQLHLGAGRDRAGEAVGSGNGDDAPSRRRAEPDLATDHRFSEMLCKSCRRQVSRSDLGLRRLRRAGRRPRAARARHRGRAADPAVGGPLSIGRGTDNLIRIEGETVSRHHARIVVEAGRALRRGRGLDVRDVRRRAEGRRRSARCATATSSARRRRAAASRCDATTARRQDGGLRRHPRPARRGRRRAALPAPARRDEAEAARGRRGRPAVRAPRPRRPLRPADRGRRRAAAAARRPDVARRA